jgi:peptidoglycan/LPS O-acetylase OafA/YrhL
MQASVANGPESVRGELRALTSLRGVAALAVVATHFSATAQALASEPIPWRVPRGHRAVDFFFVLSGFIMSYTYASSFLADQPGAYADFLARRVAGSYRCTVAVILLIVVLGAVSVAVSGKNIFFDTTAFFPYLVCNLLLLPGLGFGANFNGPSWSISTEIVAYLLFPALVACVFSCSRHATIASACAALFVLILLASRTPRLELSYDHSPQNVVRCLTEFSLGMLAYRAYAAGQFPLLATDGAAFGLVGACVVSLCLRVDLPAALMFPLPVIAFATNRGRASRMMEMRLPYFLGVVSYSIYLIHNPLRPMESEMAQWILGPDIAPWEAVAFAIAGTISVVPFAWITFHLIEKPSRHAIRQLFAVVDRLHYFVPSESKRGSMPNGR